MLKVELVGLAAVAVVLVRCIWQLAASFLSCHFYFLCGSHLTGGDTLFFTCTYTHSTDLTTQHTQHHTADLVRHRM